MHELSNSTRERFSINFTLSKSPLKVKLSYKAKECYQIGKVHSKTHQIVYQRFEYLKN